MEKFEYKILNLKTHGMTKMVLTKAHEDKLNELGEEGWEMVNMSVNQTSRIIHAVMKRKKA